MSVELVDPSDPYVEQLVRSSFRAGDGISLAVDRSGFREPLENAMRLIRQVDGRLAGLLCRNVKGIVLFRSPAVDSFAAIALHGLIFVNVARGARVPYLCEEIAHQGGHIIFAAATANRQRYFSCDPDQEIGEISGVLDTRAVYDVLHGLYTAYLQLRLFYKLELSRSCPADQADVALRRGNAGGVLSPAGHRLRDRVIACARLVGLEADRGRDRRRKRSGVEGI
jgi:hypothetical protein